MNATDVPEHPTNYRSIHHTSHDTPLKEKTKLAGPLLEAYQDVPLYSEASACSPNVSHAVDPVALASNTFRLSSTMIDKLVAIVAKNKVKELK